MGAPADVQRGRLHQRERGDESQVAAQAEAAGNAGRRKLLHAEREREVAADGHVALNRERAGRREDQSVRCAVGELPDSEAVPPPQSRR